MSGLRDERGEPYAVGAAPESVAVRPKRTSQRQRAQGEHAQARVMRSLREVLEKTENVGDRFAEEARRIHYNEAPARNIRGVTTPEDANALVEEGIDVMPLPVPAA